MKLPKKPPGFEKHHWHHIVPRHAGGTDEPDNLVLLTPLEHAQAHLERYIKHNNPADLYAAKILMGSLGPDGIPVDMTGIKRPEISGDNHVSKRDPNFGKKISAAKKGITTRKGYKLSAEHKKKIGNANRKPSGRKTKGSTGMSWYNNGREAKMFKDPPKGWVKGRVINA